jgi:DNA-binding NtrC family response regulator
MPTDAARTKALKLPDAMPVRTFAATVAEGVDHGTSWEGEQGSFGTAQDNALVLTDDTVSRYHARVVAVAEGVRVTDLGSTNGTFLGDVRIADAVVPHGSRLKLGRSLVELGSGLPATVDLYDEDRLGALRGQTPVMRRLMSQIRRAAQSSVGVLLIGESGTGKELFARALHDESRRANGPFITVDCASITPTLVASSLFGHERGAFTGAISTKQGAFELANGGTLFLDEVGELPNELQASLLGALERRRFLRVGGKNEISVDVRVVAATHRDLRREVNSGRFRLDLYYRLAVVSLDVPPLREHPRDIPLLIEHFVREEGVNTPVSELISEATLAELSRYHWPGNVRELKNYVQATLAMGEASLLPEPATGELSLPRAIFASYSKLAYGEARAQLLQTFEKAYLEALLERTQGNVAQAARDSHMARSHLNELLRRHGIR